MLIFIGKTNGKKGIIQMKQIPTEFFSITEIGGVGEMIYKAVRFPECVPEYDHERKEDTIVPICTYLHRPESGPTIPLPVKNC
jgi:hypothetical protein